MRTESRKADEAGRNHGSGGDETDEAGRNHGSGGDEADETGRDHGSRGDQAGRDGGNRRYKAFQSGKAWRDNRSCPAFFTGRRSDRISGFQHGSRGKADNGTS